MKIIKRIINFFRPKLTLTYRKKNGEVDSYRIRKLDVDHHFGNQKLGLSNIGIRAYCYNRKGVRSFRYEGIISLT